MRRRLGIMLGRLDAERPEVFKKRILVLAGEILKLQSGSPGIADRLVVNIRQVHDLRDFVSMILQRTAEQILEQISAEISDMSIIIDCRAAGVHLRDLFFDRLKILHITSQSIIETHSKILSVMFHHS